MKLERLLVYKGMDRSLTSSESEDEVEGGFLLDVVVGERSAVLELLAGEDESLLVWGDSFLVLDLALDGFDAVGGLNIKSDGLAGQGLDEDLHSSPESEDEVEGGFLLDVVVGERSAVLELLAGEDESLLVWGDSFLVLDLALDGFDAVGGLNIKSDGLSCKSFHEYLHL